jgi:hypothetical protein
MTTTCAQLIPALMEIVSSLLLYANNKIARLLLVIPNQENAHTPLSIAMTKMHAPLIVAILTPENA